MNPVYISPSLLDSFQYYQDAGDEAQDMARAEIIGRLNGVKITSDAAQKGIDFENALRAFIDGGRGGDPSLLPVIEEMAAIIGAAPPRQVYVSAPVTPRVVIHGYIDFLNAGVIYDVKTTGRYEFPKYRKNTQHLAYMYALREARIDIFKYLVMDLKRLCLCVEEYRWNEAMKGELRGRVNEFLSYLETDKEMAEAFRNKEARRAAIAA